jgi:hypothetical protein
MCPPLIVNAEEMANGIRIFGEAIAEVAAHPAAVAGDAAAAGIDIHEGEVDA